MITLYLKNFKCFAEKSFTFTNEMILISAPSGSGKSTIFSAIKFVLWDEKDGTTIMYGKNKCLAQMTIDLDGQEIIITRTKRPNRLVVKTANLEMEDSSAQMFIEKHFGSSIQNTFEGNFISKSSSEQFEFLENIAYKNAELVTKFKTFAKKKVTAINSDSKILCGKLQATEQLMDNLTKQQIEKITEPILNIKKELFTLYDDESCILNKITECKLRIGHNDMLKSKIKDLDTEIKKYISYFNKGTQHVAVLKRQMAEYPDDIEKVRELQTSIDEEKIKLEVQLQIEEANLKYKIVERNQLNNTEQTLQNQVIGFTTSNVVDSESTLNKMKKLQKQLYLLLSTDPSTKIRTLEIEIQSLEADIKDLNLIMDTIDIVTTECNLKQLYENFSNLKFKTASKVEALTSLKEKKEERQIIFKNMQSSGYSYEISIDEITTVLNKYNFLLETISTNLKTIVIFDLFCSDTLTEYFFNQQYHALINVFESFLEEQVINKLHCPQCFQFLFSTGTP